MKTLASVLIVSFIIPSALLAQEEIQIPGSRKWGNYNPHIDSILFRIVGKITEYTGNGVFKIVTVFRGRGREEFYYIRFDHPSSKEFVLENLGRRFELHGWIRPNRKYPPRSFGIFRIGNMYYD